MFGLPWNQEQCLQGQNIKGDVDDSITVLGETYDSCGHVASVSTGSCGVSCIGIEADTK